jgi:hypothetical protein
MGLIEWANKKVKRMDVWDIGLTKGSVLFFTLLIVKFWPALTALDWYWYLGLGIITAIRPMSKLLGK